MGRVAGLQIIIYCVENVGGAMNNLEKEYLQARPYIEYHYPDLASALYEVGMVQGVMRGTADVIIEAIQLWLDAASLENPGTCGSIWALPKIKK